MPNKTPSKRIARRPSSAAMTEPQPPTTNGDEADDEDVSGEDLGIQPGWTAGQETMDSTSSFAQSFKPDEKTAIIKFLDDQPYASFRRHWVESTNRENGQRIVRAYTCPKTRKTGCPLCDAGDKPQAVSAFNIAIVGDDGQVIRKSWDTGARLFNVLKSYANDPKIAPLTRNFFMVSKTGKKGTVQYNVSPVRASALEEDYDMPVPDQADFDRLEKYDSSIVEVAPMRKLREAAAMLVADDDDGT